MSQALWQAVFENNADGLKSLLRRNTNGNAVHDDNGRTLLLAACQLRHHDVIRRLLKAKPPADINRADFNQRRPIWWAAKYGDGVMTSLLTQNPRQKCDVNITDGVTGLTPFYQAVLTGSGEVCQLLIKAGAQINWQPAQGNGVYGNKESPLMVTVLRGDADLCHLLLNSMCDLNAQTSDGFTALHYSIVCRRYDICRLLLQHGIRVHSESCRGLTAMALAIRDHLTSYCLLLIGSGGYNVNKKFAWAETPLEMAIRLHAAKCALTLLRWGCRVKVATDRRLGGQGQGQTMTYFRFAAEEGLTAVVKMLAEIHPAFLNEPWVRTANYPLALQGCAPIQHWLRRYSNQPMALMLLCRSKIHGYLGRQAPLKIDKLPRLASTLASFLRWSEYFPADFYDPDKEGAVDCPWDCKSTCSKSSCSTIDPSDKSVHWCMALLKDRPTDTDNLCTCLCTKFDT